MIVKLLTEHHLEFLSLKEAAEAHRSLHMSKCHIVENLMHWLIIIVGDTPSEFGSEGKAYLYTSCDDFEDVKADELYKYMWGLCLASAPSSDNISLPGAQAGDPLSQNLYCRMIQNVSIKGVSC